MNLEHALANLELENDDLRGQLEAERGRRVEAELAVEAAERRTKMLEFDVLKGARMLLTTSWTEKARNQLRGHARAMLEKWGATAPREDE